MGTYYLLTKSDKYIHATTGHRRDVLLSEGWIQIMILSGMNMSLSYEKGFKKSQ